MLEFALLYKNCKNHSQLATNSPDGNWTRLDHLKRDVYVLGRVLGLLSGLRPGNDRRTLNEIRAINAVIWRALHEQKICTTQLAADLGIHRAAFSKIVKRLVASGVAQEEQDVDDRRRKILVPTPYALQCARIYSENMDALRSELRQDGVLMVDLPDPE